jgi:hypothetical protein
MPQPSHSAASFLRMVPYGSSQDQGHALLSGPHHKDHFVFISNETFLQHTSRLPNGLVRSSCEGIVQLCWILVENEGPSCSSMG